MYSLYQRKKPQRKVKNKKKKALFALQRSKLKGHKISVRKRVCYE